MAALSVSVNENSFLTPRTPHSRSGRFEDIDLGSESVPQTEPLLRRPSNDLDHEKAKGHNNSPASRTTVVLGTALVILLLLLIGVSIQRPELLPQLTLGAEPATVLQQKLLPEGFKSISYENYTTFPLTPAQYRAECWKLNSRMMIDYGYWADAKTDVPTGQDPAVCSGTITYMLGGSVGLLADLALMAQVAGMARERNKTFLIDDSFWNRGKWSDYFEDVRMLQPGPEPGCLAPPPEEMVACPRTARHWVVNSRTALFHFTHPFFEEYENPYARGINRLKPIYESSRESFMDLLQPKLEMLELIRYAREELASPAYLSVHIRRGDRKGMSWKYHSSHIPTEVYVNAVESTWKRLAPADAPDDPVIFLASDSPSVEKEFVDSLSVDSRIYSLSGSGNAKLRNLASPSPYVQTEFNKLEQENRIQLTKGMIVDFALLSGIWNNGSLPVGTICGLSSNVCKLAALGFGWDGAFGDLEEGIDEDKKRWVEIDNAGAIMPVWGAFEVAP